MAKERMKAAGLPTPPWIGPFPEELPRLDAPAGEGYPKLARAAAAMSGWIVKSLWEHASVGLDESSLQVYEDAAAAGKAMHAMAGGLGGSCFAEAFVDGREFNLSLLAGDEMPQVLPPAEILFEGYPAGTPKIVGYRAKWETASYEYRHTPRRFDFPPADALLMEQLRKLAVDCWRVFGLRGYARVDFRADAKGQPWILEINANPCLSPDAGFAAALQAADIHYGAAVARILADALT
jgi:D-alanine-D-alanine ligase